MAMLIKHGFFKSSYRKLANCINYIIHQEKIAGKCHEASSAYSTFSECAISNKMHHFIDTHHTCVTHVREYAKKTSGKQARGGNKTTATLSDQELMDVLDIHDYRNQLQSVLDRLKSDFVSNLSIRSQAGSIDSLLINIDNEDFPLNELAQISKKNPNLIVINMSGFPEGLKPTLQAINESGLGINPQQEGTMIYLPIPKVTREFREKLAKNAKVLCTKAKTDINKIQNQFVKIAKMQTELSEDVIFSTQKQVMSIADTYSSEAEKIMKTKQRDLLGDD